MPATWTVKDDQGTLHPEFLGTSRLECERKVVPGHYDAFRLQVSASYRQLFDRALTIVLKREGWRIVRC